MKPWACRPGVACVLRVKSKPNISSTRGHSNRKRNQKGWGCFHVSCIADMLHADHICEEYYKLCRRVHPDKNGGDPNLSFDMPSLQGRAELAVM